MSVVRRKKIDTQLFCEKLRVEVFFHAFFNSRLTEDRLCVMEVKSMGDRAGNRGSMPGRAGYNAVQWSQTHECQV